MRCANESVRMTSRFNSLMRIILLVRSVPKKRSIFATVEKDEGVRFPIQGNPRKYSMARRWAGSFLFSHTSCVGWGRLQLSLSRGERSFYLSACGGISSPSITDQKDTRYCSYHRGKSHKLEQCIIFRRILYEKHKTDKILFQKGVFIINNLSFPKYGSNRKGSWWWLHIVR